jgi:hypothetical protein
LQGLQQWFGFFRRFACGGVKANQILPVRDGNLGNSWGSDEFGEAIHRKNAPKVEIENMEIPIVVPELVR